MKKTFLVLSVLSVLSVPAMADPYDGTGVYSKATPNCVPAVTALFWWDVGYNVMFARAKERAEFDWRNSTPACWLGKASKALGIRHKRLYTPAESKRIVAWFERQRSR